MEKDDGAVAPYILQEENFTSFNDEMVDFREQTGSHEVTFHNPPPKQRKYKKEKKPKRTVKNEQHSLLLWAYLDVCASAVFGCGRKHMAV